MKAGCPYCGGSWATSSGPGRNVGGFANSIMGVFAPIPDDYEFEYCKRCKVRNMTEKLEKDLQSFEESHLARQPWARKSGTTTSTEE